MYPNQIHKSQKFNFLQLFFFCQSQWKGKEQSKVLTFSFPGIILHYTGKSGKDDFGKNSFSSGFCQFSQNPISLDQECLECPRNSCLNCKKLSGDK